METVHDFESLINETGQSDAICLDMSKEFGRVPHDNFIQMLSILWIQSYVSSRSQVVVNDGVT